VLEEKRQRSVNLKFTRLPMPNMYASAVCSGKVTPGGKRENKANGGIAKGCGKVMNNRRKVTKKY
tara:strand:+ start:124 stop:318 length:195 start_codon:yes stop_codon:yes gene_type:complete